MAVEGARAAVVAPRLRDVAAARPRLRPRLRRARARGSVQDRTVSAIVWGKLLNLDTFHVQVFDSTEKLANVSRADVREMTMTSPMPSYRDKLTTQELADVVGYLMTLKGQ